MILLKIVIMFIGIQNIVKGDDIQIENSIKILPYFDQSVKTFWKDHERIDVEDIVSRSISRWESLLNVSQTMNQFWVERKCNLELMNHYDSNIKITNNTRHCYKHCYGKNTCGSVNIPLDHLDYCYFYDPLDKGIQQCGIRGKGIQGYNMLIYFSAFSNLCYKKPLTSKVCQLDVNTDRPLVATINFCNKIVTLDSVLHEIGHVLGFDGSLQPFWRNPVTGKSRVDRPPNTGALDINRDGYYKWNNKVVVQRQVQWKSTTGVHNIQRLFLVTDTVIQVARQHFNCPTLDGVELSNPSHWKKRLLINELMTDGRHSQHSAISNFTLALMKDTGWYIPDFTKADDIQWGKNLGCNFVKKSCFEWFQSGKVSPYCNKVPFNKDDTVCDWTHNIPSAYCDLRTVKTNVPEQFRYFQEETSLDDVLMNYTKHVKRNIRLDSMKIIRSGTDPETDYCPYPMSYHHPGHQSTCHDNTIMFNETQTKLRCIVQTQQLEFNRNQNQTIILPIKSETTCMKTKCTKKGIEVLVNGSYQYCKKIVMKTKEMYSEKYNKYYKIRSLYKCPSSVEVCGSKEDDSQGTKDAALKQGGMYFMQVAGIVVVFLLSVIFIVSLTLLYFLVLRKRKSVNLRTSSYTSVQQPSPDDVDTI